MEIRTAHVRIARPARDLAGLRRFYVEGLGMTVLHEGEPQVDGRRWNLLMCGFQGAGWHLEFTRCESGPVVPSPSVEDLLVIYLGDPASVRDLSRALLGRGGAAVPSDRTTRTGTPVASRCSTPTGTGWC